MRHLRFPAWAFLFTIASLLILFLLLPTKTYSSTERRYLAEAPTLESLTEGDFSESVEDYLADHFPGRNLFVGINAYWNLLTGRNAAGGVYNCADGYLITAPEGCTTDQLQKNLERFNAFAESTGLPTTLMMIPTAGDILEDVLPANHAPYRYEECLALAQELCTDMQVLELSTVLSEAAQTEQVYYKTDHHLTSAGCYAVYSAFSGAEHTYTVTSYDGFRGASWTSSGYWLTPAETLETWDAGDDLTVTIIEAGSEDVVSESAFFLENLESDDWYTVFLDGNHALVDIKNADNSDGGTLLVLRDSYGHCMAPFLASDYSEVILVDLRYYRYSISDLAAQYGATEIAIIYGLDSMLTDTNSAWLM